MLTLTYLGHAAVMMHTANHTLLIDPFLTNNPVAPIKASEIKKCDYILVTHGHPDHLGDTLSLALRHKSVVIATWELANYLQHKGAHTHPMSVGGSHEFPFGRVKMTPAIHGCGSGAISTEIALPANTPVGYLISMNKKTIYHAGDTALFSDMKLIGKKNKIDAAFLPIGDNFTMGFEDAAHANEFLNADICVPIHYNTWDIIQADAKAFEFKIEKQGKKCITLEPGAFFEI